MVPRPKFFKRFLKQRDWSYEVSTDPPYDSQFKGLPCMPALACPDWSVVCYTEHGLPRHRVSKHSETYTNENAQSVPVGVKPKRLNTTYARPPRGSQAESWKFLTGKVCPLVRGCVPVSPNVAYTGHRHAVSPLPRSASAVKCALQQQPRLVSRTKVSWI